MLARQVGWRQGHVLPDTVEAGDTATAVLETGQSLTKALPRVTRRAHCEASLTPVYAMGEEASQLGVPT